MKLYSADISPFGQRVTMMLEHKGIAFTTVLPPGGLKSEDYARINPMAKLPVLDVGDINLPESQIICDYLEEAFPEPPFLPDDLLERAGVRLVARICDSYVMNPMMSLFRNLSRKTRDQQVSDAAVAEILRGLGWLDHWIQPARHARSGQLTLADGGGADPSLRRPVSAPFRRRRAACGDAQRSRLSHAMSRRAAYRSRTWPDRGGMGRATPGTWLTTA